MPALRLVQVALATLLLALLPAAHGTDQPAAKVKLDEIVAGHLDSIGKAEIRKVKTRVVEGPMRFSVLIGGTGTFEGKAGMVSEDTKVRLMLKLAPGTYPGEQFIFDGNKTQVAALMIGPKRSAFGEFVHVHDVVLREGLLGGVWSVSWPLLDLNGRKPTLTYDGLKTMDGKQLHRVHYKPKKGADLEIDLYFDPATLHHVLTVYSLTIGAPMIAGGDEAQVGRQETRYVLEERFSDFKSVDGLTLPNHYVIHFSQQVPFDIPNPAAARVSVLEWDVTANRILTDVSLDPRNFLVK